MFGIDAIGLAVVAATTTIVVVSSPVSACEAQWRDQLFESTLAHCFVTHWQITIMLVAEGRRFRQEINMLAPGSATRFLRMLSYGLANLRTTRMTSFQCERASLPTHQKTSMNTRGQRYERDWFGAVYGRLSVGKGCLSLCS
ncbi:hypothetical protein, partial [Mesorhizobium sp.]|uniref:hypothetical protein n=1 Tax=Mesorhizobium sp. TaxID=1871066 RepID=UPI0025BB9AF4